MNEVAIATRKRRIFAFLIDHIIFSCFGAISIFISLGNNWDQAEPQQMMKMFTVIMPIIFIIYFCKDSIYGMSLGRFIFGIAVRDCSVPNKVPGILRLALRNLILVIWPIEFFVLTFNKQKRRLGDLAAKTIVVRRTNIGLGKRLAAFAFLALLFVVLFITSIGFIIKNSAAYKVAVNHIENSPEVLALTGPILDYGFPMGSIQIQNQYGYGQLSIKVKGQKDSINVIVFLEKTPGSDWQIKQTEIKQ